jgi:protocatechuate 3,4-dioxygenase beta subunit
MILEIEKKLKRRKPFATAATTISTTTVITVLSITVLMTTYMTFISLPQSSFAQTATTTNANQPTPAAAQSSQRKGLITPCTLTESGGQGPEYKPGPPFRQGQDFAKGIPGQRLIVTGKVLNLMNCKPVQGAVLDIWQTNSTGDYDYKGFNLRSKVVTDKDGNYVLNTVYPVRLQGPNEMTRPSHIHVIVGVPGQPLITTQVYFENQPKDSLLKDSLIALPVTAANGTKIAHFNFVVEDYRGFDISKGIEGNPTIGVISGQGSNKK